MEWKYQIGDVLTHRLYLADPVVEGAPRFLVLERMAQECPGGVQLHYLVRGTSEEQALIAQPDRLLEHELVPYAEYALASRQSRDDRLTRVEALSLIRDKLDRKPAPPSEE